MMQKGHCGFGDKCKFSHDMARIGPVMAAYASAVYGFGHQTQQVTQQNEQTTTNPINE